MVLTIAGVARGFAFFWAVVRWIIRVGAALRIASCKALLEWLESNPFPEVYG